MSAQELAQYLQFSVSTIYKLVRRGEVPFIRIGNKLWFKLSDVRLWVKYQEKNQWPPDWDRN